MKSKLTLLILLAVGTQAFSQSKNTVSLIYATTSNDVNIHGSIGDFGYTGKGGSQFGLNYTRDFNNIFALQTGLVFSSDNIQLNSSLPGNTGPKNGNIKLVNIPVIASVSFFKILFIDGGPLAHFETNYSNSGADAANYSATKQNGIGFELGIGAKYNFGSLNVFVNPFLQDHSIIRFNNSNSNFNLFDSGFKFGAGYSF